LDAIAFKPFEITDTGTLALYAMTVLTTIENIIKRRIICPPWKIETRNHWKIFWLECEA